MDSDFVDHAMRHAATDRSMTPKSGFETCPSTTPARRNGEHACNLPKGHTGPHRSVYGSGWTNEGESSIPLSALPVGMDKESSLPPEPSLDDRLAAKLQRQRQGIIDPILFERGVTDPDGANLKDGTTFDAETGEQKPELVTPPERVDWGIYIAQHNPGNWGAYFGPFDAAAGRYPIASGYHTRIEIEAFAEGYAQGAEENK